MEHEAHAPRLSAELEAGLLRELRKTYQDLNASYFKRSLRAPEIRLSDTKSRLGLWDLEKRCIEISRPLIVSFGWGAVVEVLKHEMAHQYVHEILGRTTEPAHGPAFREVCERLSIDARAAGLPESSGGSDPSASPERQRHLKVLERISQLLALAQSSNVHEAETATSLAQRLMLKYNIESSSLGAQTGYSYRHLGVPSGRVSESERLLSVILGEHFFVEVIWVPVYRPFEQKRGQVLEICGTLPNIEMATYVHAFLTHSSARLWEEHKREHGIRENRERRTYLAGVMEGFRDKLKAETRKNREQGLVWIGDADLERYYRQRHPHIRHTRSMGQARTEAHGAGRQAGRKLVLHRGITQASSTSAPALLPPRRT